MDVGLRYYAASKQEFNILYPFIGMVTVRGCINAITDAMEDVKAYLELEEYDGALDHWRNVLFDKQYTSLRPEIIKLPGGDTFASIVDGVKDKLELGEEGGLENDYAMFESSAAKALAGAVKSKI